MFCPECGKKYKKSDKFCGHCGAKLGTKGKTSKSKVVKKEVSKKTVKRETKILIGLTCFLLALLIVGYNILASRYKPSNVAKDYFVAKVTGDADKLYEYLNVDNSGLTSKKIFKEVSSMDKHKLLNYRVSKEEKSKDGLTSTVEFSYTTEGSSKASTTTVNLVKDKRKKMLIFDDWKIGNSNSEIVSKYRITVAKDATVKLEGVALDKKWRQEVKDEDSYVTYEVPKLFKGKYDVEVILKNGLTLKEKINVGSYGSSSLTNLSLADSEKDKLAKSIPNSINSLYQHALEKKAFGDIKKDYEYDGANLEEFEKSYTSFVESIGESGLTKFKASDAKIVRVRLNSDGTISTTAMVSYEYTATKKLFEEEKTQTRTTSSTMYLDFAYADGEFKLVDISSVPRYFSVL